MLIFFGESGRASRRAQKRPGRCLNLSPSARLKSCPGKLRRSMKRSASEGIRLKTSKAQRRDWLQRQLELDQKYQTLTPEQRQQLNQEYQTLGAPKQQGSIWQHLLKGGATYQAPTQYSGDATPKGGTAAADEQRAIELASVKRPMKEYASPDGKSRDWFQPGTEPEGWQASQGAGSGTTRPVPYYAGAMSLQTAASMAQQGMAFEGADGQPFDLTKLPQGSVLIPVYESGGKHYWSVGTDKGRYETAGNERVLEPAVGGPNPQAPSIGPARVGTTTTQTAPGGGQVVTQTTTPATPGRVLPKAVTPTAGAKPVHAGGVGGALPKAQPESVLPNIQNMTPRNAALAQKTQPAVSALLGIYGDPQNPTVPSLMGYAKLADDPHSQKVLGEAFKLLDQQMGEISDPGIIQTLGTAGGWANFRAQAEAGAQQSAGTEMTPQEREYFDTAIASMADIIGARAATGQSPARFSVRAMQNELPLIGLSGTSDQASYLTKLETIGRQVGVGLNAMPDNSRALGWLNKRIADIAKQKAATSHNVGDVKTFPNGKKGVWDGTGWVAQ